MKKCIQTFVVLVQLAFASGGFCNQEELDARRTRKLQGVFEAIQQGDKTALASLLSGLSSEEASKMLNTLSKHWGDAGKLVKVEDNADEKLDKGKMKTIVHWGTESTQAGTWLRLSSPDAKGTVMRIGLLFPKDSSEARQFMAVEWDVPAAAPAEKPRGTKK